MRDRSTSGDFIRGVDSMADKTKRGAKALMRLGIVALGIVLTVAIFWTKENVSRDQAYFAYKFLMADLADDFVPRRIISVTVSGAEQRYRAGDITSNAEWRAVYTGVMGEVGAGFLYGGMAALASLGALYGLATYKGRRRRQDEKLRGGDRLEADKLIAKMRKEKSTGAYCIGRSPNEPQTSVAAEKVPATLRAELLATPAQNKWGVMLPTGAETAHIGICGASRTGKSLTLQIMLNSIAREGQTAIVYDPHLSLFSRYYDPGCGDVVLNPMDERCPLWTPWAELDHAGDADALAESFIPTPPNSNQPFFTDAARLIFAAALLKLPAEQRTAAKLVEALLSLSNDEIKALAGKLEAGRLMDAKSADEVRASLAVGIRALKYLRAGPPETEAAVFRSQLAEWKAMGRKGRAPRNPGEGFSLRQWIKELDTRTPAQGERFRRRPWVWIIARGDHQAAIRPLITTWFDVIGRQMLSMDENLSRRLFLAVEELPQIGKVPSLAKLLAEGGKFGVSLIAVWQAWSQLVEVWGREGAFSLLGNFSTFACFRVEDTSGLQHYVAKLGKVEKREATESLRLGSSDDNAVQVSDQKHTREIVHEGELTTLKPLHGFLKMPGQPITMIRQPDPAVMPFLPEKGRHPAMVDMPQEVTVFGALLDDAAAPAQATGNQAGGGRQVDPQAPPVVLGRDF